MHRIEAANRIQKEGSPNKVFGMEPPPRDGP